MRFRKLNEEQLKLNQEQAYIAYKFKKKVYHRRLYEESLARKEKGRKVLDGENWCVVEVYEGKTEVLGNYDSYIDAKFACEDYAKIKAILVSIGGDPQNYGEFRVVKSKRKRPIKPNY